MIKLKIYLAKLQKNTIKSLRQRELELKDRTFELEIQNLKTKIVEMKENAKKTRLLLNFKLSNIVNIYSFIFINYSLNLNIFFYALNIFFYILNIFCIIFPHS